MVLLMKFCLSCWDKRLWKITRDKRSMCLRACLRVSLCTYIYVRPRQQCLHISFLQTNFQGKLSIVNIATRLKTTVQRISGSNPILLFRNLDNFNHPTLPVSFERGIKHSWSLPPGVYASLNKRSPAGKWKSL